MFISPIMGLTYFLKCYNWRREEQLFAGQYMEIAYLDELVSSLPAKLI